MQSTGQDENSITNRAAAFFSDLQDKICAKFESFEPTARFECTPWDREEPEDETGRRLNGGGERRVMKGDVFEKVGVNFSDVHGTFSKQFRGDILGAQESGGAFRACGISLVSHMVNPYVPAVHMNVRFLETSQSWFGGGADLTPTFPFDEDSTAFHASLKAACDDYRPDAYQEYKEWCDRYFYLPHRQEPRGIGGIFFDNLNSGDQEADFAFVQAVGLAFLDTYPMIVERRKDLAYGDEEREKLFYKRGRYVEFNLVYDRGTKFGFATGADPENYLMSMPPIVKW